MKKVAFCGIVVSLLIGFAIVSFGSIQQAEDRPPIPSASNYLL